MLRLEGLRIVQGDFGLTADLEVSGGDVTAILGPSGGGKSSLLACVAGFLPPVAGRVLIEGQDVTNQPPHARPVSMLFQDNNLFAHLTIAHNVGLGLRPRGRLTPQEEARVSAVLEQVGLGDLRDRLPGTLSGGQQSRAALARVLVADRALVLLDEPFAALGPGLRDEMLALACETLLGSGRSVMLVTHDPAEAEAVARQVIFVNAGVAAPPRETAAIMAHPDPALARYLGRAAR